MRSAAAVGARRRSHRVADSTQRSTTSGFTDGVTLRGRFDGFGGSSTEDGDSSISSRETNAGTKRHDPHAQPLPTEITKCFGFGAFPATDREPPRCGAVRPRTSWGHAAWSSRLAGVGVLWFSSGWISACRQTDPVRSSSVSRSGVRNRRAGRHGPLRSREQRDTGRRPARRSGLREHLRGEHRRRRTRHRPGDEGPPLGSGFVLEEGTSSRTTTSSPGPTRSSCSSPTRRGELGKSSAPTSTATSPSCPSTTFPTSPRDSRSPTTTR